MSDETLSVGGATVTLNTPAAEAAPKPSEQIVKTANKSFDVTDANGRVITLKKPNPLAGLDFTKAAGAFGVNQLYLSEIAHLKYVAAIDGVAVATPTTDGELRALYVRLGEEGNEVAQIGVYENFMPKAAPEADDSLKNG